jgi:hypothetical protein
VVQIIPLVKKWIIKKQKLGLAIKNTLKMQKQIKNRFSFEVKLPKGNLDLYAEFLHSKNEVNNSF